MEILKVYGTIDGECAWCLKNQVTKSYLALDTQGELSDYQVCDKCYIDFAPENSEVEL